jgi:hypothetical protein
MEDEKYFENMINYIPKELWEDLMYDVLYSSNTTEYAVTYSIIGRHS